MKLMTCDLCDEAFAAETFDDWMELVMPHYMAEHGAVMAANKDKPKEEREKWIEDNKERFDAATTL